MAESLILIEHDRQRVKRPSLNAIALARQLGGEIFFGFISAIAFATILAVVAGLTISASTSFAHDFYTNVIHHGRLKRPQDEVLVARAAAFVVGAVAILIAILLGPAANVAFLVALAFAVAASANLPVIVLSLFWRRFNTAGAVTGLAAGLAASLTLILVSPSIMGAKALFPLENPGIVSIPIGFIGAIAATLLTRERTGEQKFDELVVRATTGLGAERPS